jgi:hypothetical protein
MLHPKAELLYAFARPLYANAGPLHVFAQRLHEGDERIAEESRGYRAFARTPEPSRRRFDARGERPSLQVGSVEK